LVDVMRASVSSADSAQTFLRRHLGLAPAGTTSGLQDALGAKQPW
ncbi:MAG: hypothetical protein RIT45_1571, partial [Pseudomonadota bacterium]